MVTATCGAPDQEDVSVSATVTVGGTQPTTAMIVAELGTLGTPFDSADLRRIACHESPGLLQFRPSPGPPAYGGGGDVGIMQICHERTREDIWNWRSNISHGRSVLAGAKRAAELYLEDLVFNQGADDFTDQMWREEAIHRYNAGPYGPNRYRIWVPADDGNRANGRSWTRVGWAAT